MRALTRRERIGALVVGAMDLMDILLDASLSRSFGGKTIIFGVLELVTISKLLLFMFILVHS